MAKEKGDERGNHFVISTNAFYGAILSMFLGGAGTYGTLSGELSPGANGQCADNAKVALQLSERNGQDIQYLRDVISRGNATYRTKEAAEAAEADQRERDERQDRRADLIERTIDLHTLSEHEYADVQRDK